MRVIGPPTERQIQIVELVSKIGKKATAKELGLSETYVKKVLFRVRQKVNAYDRQHGNMVSQACTTKEPINNSVNQENAMQQQSALEVQTTNITIVTAQYSGDVSNQVYYLSGNNDIIQIRGTAFETLDGAFSALMALKTPKKERNVLDATKQDDKKDQGIAYDDPMSLMKGLKSLVVGMGLVVDGVSTSYDLGELTKSVSAMERLGGSKFKVDPSKKDGCAVITRIE